MSYSDSIQVVANDYGYDLEFQILDAEGNAVDLTGLVSGKVKIYEPGASSAKVNASITVVDTENGLCRYQVKEGDFDVAGKTYHVEIELTYSSKVVTAKGVTIKVLPEAPD